MSNEIRVAVYCRVANMDDNAIKAQEATMIDFAKAQGYENITVYSDNGFSGLNLNRPAFKQMENDILSGAVGLVMSKDTSRISRNIFDTLGWLDRIKRSGVSFKTLHGDEVFYIGYSGDKLFYCPSYNGL